MWANDDIFNKNCERARVLGLSHTHLTGSQRSVTLIAEAKADLQHTDSFGKAPVHYALLAGAVHILSALHFLGADFSQRSLNQKSHTICVHKTFAKHEHACPAAGCFDLACVVVVRISTTNGTLTYCDS
eukprot:164486-Amphidinium_carterae.1